MDPKPDRFDSYLSRYVPHKKLCGRPTGAIGRALASSAVMSKLQLVKSRDKDDRPRRGRGATIAKERRYRYPAEEIWEVSEERWRGPDTPSLRPKGIAAD